MLSNKSKKNKFMVSKYYVRILMLLVVTVMFGTLAEYFWFFELFSHFVVQYAFVSAILFLLLFVSGRYIPATVALAVFSWQAYQVAPLWKEYPQVAQNDQYENVKVMQYNVHRANYNMNEVTNWITARSGDVDIVVLTEVNDNWGSYLDRIKWTYPYHISQKIRGDRHMIVLSKLLIDEMEVRNLGDYEVPTIIMRGTTSKYELPFVLQGVHPNNPIMPTNAKKRNNVLMAAATTISDEDARHKILLGDFNTTRFSPWFKNMERVSGLRDSNIGQGIVNTWGSFMPSAFGLSLDNILISEQIKVSAKEIGPSMGSDHFPVITTLQFMVNKDTDI